MLIVDRLKRAAAVVAPLLGALGPAAPPTLAASYPLSPLRIAFDWTSVRRLAEGSDNWPVTWAADGRVYTIWGDGGGFAGRFPYVSIGLGALTGATAATIRGVSLIGGDRPAIAPCFPFLPGTLPETRPWAGCQGKAHAKSYGVLALGDALYAWTQPGSCRPEYGNATLHRNRLGTNEWASAGWELTGLFSPTFVQKGRDHAVGGYVHLYAVRIAVREPDAPCLSVMGTPVGEVVAARARKDADLLDRRAWAWWNGSGWGDGAVKAPMFREPAGIGPKISATYVPGLGRFVLVSEVGGSAGGRIAFHESPWATGPWRELGEFRFPGTTFLATIMPQSLRPDGRLTVGFTGGQENDALNLVDARIVPR